MDSRRLGRSLGINLVPFKTCSMDCTYCECGSTTFLTNERKDFFPAEVILEELEEKLAERKSMNKGSYNIDYITFSGLGEPLLYRSFGKILGSIREKYPDLKTCLLTNGSLFSSPEVRREAAQAHLVIPSLDGSNEEEFIKINRPEKSVSYQSILEGIASFRRETINRVQMFLEIFLVPQVNDSPESAERFRSLVEKIQPDAVQLNYLDRPGVYADMQSVSEEVLELFYSVLSPCRPVEIPVRKNTSSGTNFAGIEFEMLEVLQKNGKENIEGLSRSLDLPETECVRHLRQLRKAGFAEEFFDIQGQGGNFLLTEKGTAFLQGKK